MNPSIVREEVDVYVGKDTSFPDEITLQNKYGISSPKKEADIAIEKNSGAAEFALREDKLLNLVSEKNRQIERMCVLMEALEPAPGMDAEKYRKIVEAGIDDGVDFRDSKIVSLAKKCQNLTMTLNKERHLSENLSQQLSDQRQQTDNLAQQLAAASKAGSPTRNFGPKLAKASPALGTISVAEASQIQELKREVTSTSKTLREANKCIDDLKQKVFQLTEENKTLTRTLQLELGDATTVDVACSVDSGWRGRAQHIVMLKAKIRKLEQESGAKSTGTVVSSRYGTTSVAKNVDSKAEGGLAGMSSERRMVVEALTEERSRLIEVNQELEKKNSAYKARIQNLEIDSKKMKENLQLVLNKTSTDDELLEALRGEISKLKFQLNSARNSERANEDEGSRRFPQSQLGKDKDPEVSRLQVEILRLQRLCKQQAEQIDSQDETIRRMKKSFGVNI